MYNVNAKGKVVFSIEPSKSRPIARKLTFFKFFSEGFIITATYDVHDMNNRLLASFTAWNNGNRFVLTLYDTNGKKLSYFEQYLTRSVLKNRGTLFRENDTFWRELVAKNMAGDIDVIDENGKITVSHRYGVFSHAANTAFQAESFHRQVKFGNHISDEEKLAYTMIFFSWLKN